MARFLIMNDEQKILHLLFSHMDKEVGEADYADGFDQGVAMAAGGRYDVVIIQAAPSSPFLQGRTIPSLMREAREKIPAFTRLFLTNLKSIRTRQDIAAFGVSDFIISGAALESILTANIEAVTGEREAAAEKDKLKKTVIALSNIFQSLLDLEEPFQKKNIDAVVECGRNVAVLLRLPRETVDATEVAAACYDIGKIGLQRELLWKNGMLDGREQVEMRSHPAAACELLAGVPFPWDVLPIVRHHHERFDGTGYPDGLKGRQIPIGARIISVVDSFFSMISRRPYRKSYGIEEAFYEINKNAGTQFDPEVVEAFVEVAREYFAGKGPTVAAKILLADDDVRNLARLKLALQVDGYEVLCARTFDEALDLARKHLPDMIISEFSLRGGEGLTLLETVRATAELRGAVFFFLTSPPSSEQRIRAFRLGADDFVTKPFEVGEVVLKIGNLLRRVIPQVDVAPPKSAGVTGDIREFGLVDLLQVVTYGHKTVLITVKRDALEGKVYVELGRLKYATLASLAGKEALFAMLAWDSGLFILEHGVTVDRCNIREETIPLLLEADQRGVIAKNR